MTHKKIDRYEIVSEIGQGAMGVVYRANDPLLERTVAIKTISLELSKDEFDEFEKRFYREASSAGRLNHPNIVTIHDVGNTDNVAYMAMEFLEGEELRDILDSGKELTVDRIAEITAQVADGLAFAHEHGVVHRDIKPSNIMVMKNGVAKITDFGIALIPAGSRTMDGMVLGSPKYMSPEQVVGREVDGRSDIFSLGVMLYEMLTGKSPFSGDNISTIMYRILNEMPALPSTLKPELPEAFDYIIAKALAKHPDERYANAAEIAHDLRNYASLQIPGGFNLHPDGKPRTLERRAKPRNVEDKTVMMEARKPPVSFARRWKYAALIAVAAIILGILIVFLDRKPTEPIPATPVSPPVTQPQELIEPAKPVIPAEEEKPREEASLNLAITPWGEIFVDGQSHGVSPPLLELKLSPGKHTIEVRNTGFAAYTETVELSVDKPVKIRHKFD